MTSEAQTQQEIRLAASAAGCTLFRNNIGGYQDASGRWIKYGVCNPGGSDLLGWLPVVITADMVGRTVAVFTAIEVKAPRGRATDAQVNFIAAVIAAGGRAGIARSTDDLRAIVKG